MVPIICLVSQDTTAYGINILKCSRSRENASSVMKPSLTLIVPIQTLVIAFIHLALKCAGSSLTRLEPL